MDNYPSGRENDRPARISREIRLIRKVINCIVRYRSEPPEVGGNEKSILRSNLGNVSDIIVGL